MSKPWDYLEEYRGRLFHGRWPTLPELLEITCLRHGDRRGFTAFEPAALSLSWNEILAAVRSAAAWLQDKGVRRGDRVAVTGKNSPEWAVAYLAVLYAGGIVVPLDYQLSREETAGLIRTVEAPVLFVDEEKHELFDRGNCGIREKVSLSPGKPNYILDLRRGRGEPPNRDGWPSEKDTAAILFTSGTTGAAKGVALSHANLVADTILSQDNIAVLSTDVFYALLPVHHSYTMTAVFLESLANGCEVVFGTKMVSKQILEDLKRGQVTMFLGVPMLFNRLLHGLKKGIREKGVVVYGAIRLLMTASGLIKRLFRVNPGKRMFRFLLEKVSLEHIRICISGGGPLPASTFRQFNQLGIDFVQGYGLTETSPIVTLNPVEHYKPASVGKPIPEVQIRILDPDEHGRGEIALRGPVIMQGYYRNEEATREVLSPDGWLRTGDVGYLDHERYLYLTGRAKSMIVTEGGKNVYPEEIEDRFQLYGEVEQVLVRGYLADRKMKVEAIEALIYPSADYLGVSGPQAWKGADAEAIRGGFQKIVDEVNGRLLPYQRISRFSVLEAPMEMTTTKKIKRFTVQ
jgi:long-chain acyl-CoA synthetase